MDNRKQTKKTRSDKGEGKMGIIKWWNDRKIKPTEVVHETPQETVKEDPYEIGSKAPTTREGMEELMRRLNPGIKGEPVLPIGFEKVEVHVFDNDAARVEHYKASGGEIVDMSNKPRKDHDGFPPDRELLTPFNRAHEGTKAGLAGMVGRKR